MNAARLFTLSVAALTVFGTASQVAQAQGKSRAEVKQELVQAHHTGVIPSSKTQYPPDANTIARNKQTHAIALWRDNLDERRATIKLRMSRQK